MDKIGAVFAVLVFQIVLTGIFAWLLRHHNPQGAIIKLIAAAMAILSPPASVLIFQRVQDNTGASTMRKTEAACFAASLEAIVIFLMFLSGFFRFGFKWSILFDSVILLTCLLAYTYVRLVNSVRITDHLPGPRFIAGSEDRLKDLDLNKPEQGT